MSLNDPLSDVLSHILNCEKKNKKECIVGHDSKFIRSILYLLKEEGYIGSFDVHSSARGGSLKISLLGHINACSVIKPRFSFTKTNHEKFQKRYLPAKDFGFLVISTSQGIMTHNQSLAKGTGGKLIAYCY